MTRITHIVFAAIVFAPTFAVAQDCASDVPAHLDWCSRDHGFNEGATCGINTLGSVLTGLPAVVAQPILGNVWDRTNMMGAAKVAWNAGYTQQAIDAAVCCQIHNPSAQACLAAHRDLVAAWFERNSH